MGENNPKIISCNKNNNERTFCISLEKPIPNIFVFLTRKNVMV